MNSHCKVLVFTVIDSEGYRPNVGIILCNAEGRLFWAKADRAAFLAVSPGRHPAG
jgi:hypothetical protein